MEYRYVPGCLATQRSPDDREAKKKTKLQNVAITLAADVSKSRASGNRNETTAFCGSADSISSGVRTSWTSSPVSGSGDTTRARFPKISGMKRLSHAHQVHSVRPSTSKRWCIGAAARPPKPSTRPSSSRQMKTLIESRSRNPRGHAHQPPERVGQVALVREPGVERDHREPVVGAGEPVARELDPALADVFADRAPVVPPECAGEMHAVDATGLCEGG